MVKKGLNKLKQVKNMLKQLPIDKIDGQYQKQIKYFTIDNINEKYR